MRDETFRDNLAATYGLPDAMIERLIEDVADHYGLTVEEFVRTRHLELQRHGMANERAYRRILQECEERRFRVAGLTLRRIRRMIYG